MLLYDRKSAFAVKWLWIGMALVTVVVFCVKLDTVVGVIRDNQPLESSWTINFIMSGLTDESMQFLLPVLCTLPYSSGFVDECKAGIIRFSLSRVEKKKYLWSKVLTAAVSGGGILVASAVAASLIACVLFVPLQQPDESGQTILNIIMPLIRLYVRYFCFGSLCAISGLLISTAANSRYMAWLGPFMAVYLLIIFCERYFKGCVVLYPREWLNPSEAWPLKTWSVCIWMAVLMVFAGWMYMLSASRRLRYV